MKKVKSAKAQQAVWQQQVKQIGEFKDTEMYFICQCARFKTHECEQITKKFKTVADLCQATQKELNAINSRLVDILAMLGCIPKPTQYIPCSTFEKLLDSIAKPALLTRTAWQKHYLDHAFQGQDYEKFFQKNENTVYIFNTDGLNFLTNPNSWSWQILCTMWGQEVMEQIVFRAYIPPNNPYPIEITIEAVRHSAL